MKQPKILALAGSARHDSFNKKLIKIGTEALRQAGGHVTLIDLVDFPLPLYDGDLEAEQGLPKKAKELKKLFCENDGFIFSSPEYNSSISGVFKNVIDWVSRPEKEDSVSLIAFRGKIAALMSASSGALGGLRGLVHLRAILENIYVMVIPEQITIPKAGDAFDEKGLLNDPQQHAKILDLARKHVSILNALHHFKK
jgi:chromate reductase